jgi:hypothetical protein
VARVPPRLDWQPIFYPVLTEDYTTRIAGDWNTKDEANGAVGYVTRFTVLTEFLALPGEVISAAGARGALIP